MRVKNEKGITLVALIITIIIMLILLGVSAEIVINGELIGTTEDAVEQANNKVNVVQNDVNTLMNEWEDIESSL